MPTGQATVADVEMIERVERRGRKVSVRQLQAWRRLGIIPGPPVVRKGRGKGTESGRYPDGAEDAVILVLDVLGKCERMPLVVLALFGAGVNPTGKALMNAYRWLVDRLADAAAGGLVELDEYGDRSGQHVRRFISASGEVPGVRQRWNRQAKAEADAERAMGEDYTGKPIATTRSDVRERGVRLLYESMLDREDGDVRPFAAALGMDEQETDEQIGRTGGPPDVGELAAFLDEIDATVLVRLRDHLRSHWAETFAPALPRALAAEVEARWDDPASAGLWVASMVLHAGAVCHRAFIRSLDERAVDTA